MSIVQHYLKEVESVIAKGPYKDTWASLAKVETPKWYMNSKFGIFIHWGVYSVPAFDNEWYPRNMYQKDSKCYQHHIEVYGLHKSFGYKDFIPMFKAEKFDPQAWATLFKEAGAKYIMPVCEHHDGFQMYDSEISDWNALKMGPKRDLIRDLKKAVEEAGLTFAASSHRAENFFFFNGAMSFESGLNHEGCEEPYGYRRLVDGTDGVPHQLEDYKEKVPTEHLEDWLARCCELIDKYQPKILYFDWWIQNKEFKPYLRKLAAYYYNRGLEWGQEVAINYKEDAYVKGTAIFDVERGQLSGINPSFWQTDTSVAKNSWCYTQGNEYKKPHDIICDLIDIVSKNGTLLLNIGPKADGTIPEEDTYILKSIGSWLNDNGQAIYNTRPWTVYGEGPTQPETGAFTDTHRSDYTSEDIRYTYHPPYLYASIMKWPENGQVSLKALGKSQKIFRGYLQKISLLAYDYPVDFTTTDEELSLSVKKNINTPYPVVVKIEIS